jgi:hypothetical protein
MSRRIIVEALIVVVQLRAEELRGGMPGRRPPTTGSEPSDDTAPGGRGSSGSSKGRPAETASLAEPRRTPALDIPAGEGR